MYICFVAWSQWCSFEDKSQLEVNIYPKKSVLQKVYFLNFDFPNFQMCHWKLGISLENKAIQKLKLFQNANNEKKFS